MEPSKSKPILIHGPLGPYEDSIIGNAEGLRELLSAVEEALENGESNSFVGEIGFIHRKPDDWFPPEESSSLGFFGGVLFFGVAAVFISLIAIGFYTVITWF